MALPRQQPVEIPLGGTLDQTTGELLRGPQVLESARNVDHDNDGYASKARGYSRISLTTNTTQGDSPESIFYSVGVHRGELVLCGATYVYTVGANDVVLDGAALIRRGPTSAGNYDTGIVNAGPMSGG